MGFSREKAAEIVNQLSEQDANPESLGYLIYKVINKSGTLHYQPLIVGRKNSVIFQTEIALGKINIEPIKGGSIDFSENWADGENIYELDHYCVVNLVKIGIDVDEKINFIQGKREIEK